MPARYTNPSIRDEGLQSYLDRTAPEHNGSDYAEFMKLQAAGLDKTSIGKVFGVSRVTIAKWIKIAKEEE